MMQALSTPGQQGQQAAQAKPGSGNFSWLDAFQARQEALKAQAAGQAAFARAIACLYTLRFMHPRSCGGGLSHIEEALVILCCTLYTPKSGVLRQCLSAFSACAERLPLSRRHS